MVRVREVGEVLVGGEGEEAGYQEGGGGALSEQVGAGAMFMITDEVLFLRGAMPILTQVLHVTRTEATVTRRRTRIKCSA